MKNLQNNFTTPEQSKRLLDFGVPADSADFRQPKDNGLDGKEYIIFYNMFPFSKEVESTIFDGDNLLPCWSVGRLMEIITTCHLSRDNRFCFIEDICESLVETIFRFVKYDEIDFSKLEDKL